VVIIDRGRVVAQGTPAELSRPKGVEIETAAGMRAYPQAGRDDVPRIVAELVAAGESIYGVRVVQTSLEEAYLEAVEEAGS
jgi:ABC-2 type transport system ATP-binding protein